MNNNLDYNYEFGNNYGLIDFNKNIYNFKFKDIVLNCKPKQKIEYNLQQLKDQELNELQQLKNKELDELEYNLQLKDQELEYKLQLKDQELKFNTTSTIFISCLLAFVIFII
jgi:hypothetical protein